MVRVPIDREAQRSGAGGRGRGPAVLVAALLAFAIAAVLGFAAAFAGSDRLRGALMEQSGATTTRGALRAVALAPVRFVRAATHDVPADYLILDVKFRHMHAIHEIRDEALRTAELTTSDGDLVPASIDVAGRTVRAKLRLAGGRADLLAGEKWPLRVHTDSDGHVFGMRRLELKDPAVRGFQAESLFLEHLRGEDVLAPQFFFVDVTLNGKRLGLMALEESFSAELLVRQQRRDGPMLRFGTTPAGEASPAAVAPLRPRHVEGSRKLSRSFDTAKRLLHAYLAGTLDAGDVFDAELVGRFLAIAELWGAQRALQWQNLRFYFNPMTALLEPIGHAAELQDPHRGDEAATLQAPFAARLLSDPRIGDAFDRALRRIAGEMLEESFAAEIRARETLLLRMLHREYPLRVPFDTAALLKRAARLRGIAPATATTGQPRSGGRAAAGPALPLSAPPLSETLARNPFLAWDEDSRTLRAAPGRWDVQGSLILPAGAGLTLSPGTILRFQQRQGIIARGPLTFLGEASAPVVLEGPVGAKKSKLWSGVYVVSSKHPSRWTHVVVRNAGGFNRNGWRLAGGAVFRKTQVELDHCTFAGNRADDALNFVRSTFALRDVTIVESLSDGIDSDHSEGSIDGGLIARAGGDGIDAGGSRLTVRGTRLENIRDKAIAVGEGSRLSASRVEIEHAGIGLASKNGSEAEISDSTLRNITDVALVSYMNRPEYGPGVLAAKNNHIARAALSAIAEAGNRLLLDGTIVPPMDVAIDRLYRDAKDEP
jgi:hypothetical protein